MQSSSSRRTLLNYLGIAILMLGMACGEFIYWRSLHSPTRSSDDDLLLNPDSSRVYERTLETQVGTFGVLMVKFSRALGKLKEPGPLAITICVISFIVAGGCFVVASRLPRNAEGG